MAHEYIWSPAYLAAILETDDGRIAERVYEAMAAIEQRLGPLDEEEAIALLNAQIGLATLKRERIDRQFERRVEGPERDRPTT